MVFTIATSGAQRSKLRSFHRPSFSDVPHAVRVSHREVYGTAPPSNASRGNWMSHIEQLMIWNQSSSVMRILQHNQQKLKDWLVDVVANGHGPG